MENISLTWLITLQIGVILLVANIFQWLYSRWQLKRLHLLRRQIKEIRQNKYPPAALQLAESTSIFAGDTFLDIEEALAQTENRLQRFSTIETTAASMAKLTPLSLRLALLHAEKDALNGDEDDYWNVVEHHLAEIINAILEDFPNNSSEIPDAIQQENIANLTRLRNLFTILRTSWISLENTEKMVMPQLLQLAETSENSSDITDLLNQMHSAFAEVSNVMVPEMKTDATAIAVELFDESALADTSQHSNRLGQANDNNSAHSAENDNIQKLNNIISEQTELIADLQRQVSNHEHDDAVILDFPTDSAQSRAKAKVINFDHSILDKQIELLKLEAKHADIENRYLQLYKQTKNLSN